jgi:hypothetical protein
VERNATIQQGHYTGKLEEAAVGHHLQKNMFLHQLRLIAFIVEQNVIIQVEPYMEKLEEIVVGHPRQKNTNCLIKNVNKGVNL